jgi:hypothetical protein
VRRETPKTAGCAWWCALAVSLVLNVVQARQLRALTVPSPPDRLIGSRLHDLTMTTATGASAEISFRQSRQPTIVYYYSDSCGWCGRNLSNVVALRAAVRGDYRFIALTSSEGFEHRRVLDADLSGTIPRSTARALGLGGTPHTLVVSTTGVVLQSWRGAYRARIGREVSTYFDVPLPGIAVPVRGAPAWTGAPESVDRVLNAWRWLANVAGRVPGAALAADNR